MTELVHAQDPGRDVLKASNWDAVVAVGPPRSFKFVPEVQAALDSAQAVDAHLDKDVTLHAVATLAGGRLVFAPTGPLGRDHDDVRRYADAAKKGIVRARDAGARRPLLVIGEPSSRSGYARAIEVTVLGALAGLWEPLEAREALGAEVAEPTTKLAFAAEKIQDGEEIRKRLLALEAGRRLARDISGTQPERMSPVAMAAYCKEAFAGSKVRVEIVDDPDELNKEYPLLAAVGRASMHVERHRPCVIRLEYVGEGSVQSSLFFAGKGLVYDTGGADLKVGGHMAGMSRDKGGAAAVAGFLKTVAELAPRGIRVVAEIGAVRNSIGSDSFVADEILVAHSGKRVRIGNTDAEGRLVLADLLSHLRKQALEAKNPLIFSIATLTGHAALAMGPYSVAIENGPAHGSGIATRLMQMGDLWGDPFEISRLRREDWDFIKPRTRADDVLSCNNEPSSRTVRGHQFPLAFLCIASGLEEHGGDAAQPLAYTHLDIAGSSIEGDFQHGKPTAAPVVTLAASFLE